MTEQTVLPPAGWYPDPWDGASQRYWDGQTWTSGVAPLAPQPAGAGASAPAASESGVVGPPRGRWGWGDVGWTSLLTAALVLLPTGGLVVWVLVSGATGLDFASTGGAWLVVGLQLLMWVGMAGWPLWAGRRKGPGWRGSYGFVASGRAVLIGLVGGVVLFFGMTVLDVIVSTLFDIQINSAAADMVDQLRSVTAAFTVLLVMIAVGAPFVEELSFRGLLWGAVVKRGASPWLATLVAAVPFAVIHFEPARLLSLLYAGVLLGVIRHYGGLGSSMLAHATVNSTAAILLAFTG
jgi:membrane protease YdiL (CAAX protease family)